MIRFWRVCQWLCVIFGLANLGEVFWRALEGRWGVAFFEFLSTVALTGCWRIYGRNIERARTTAIVRDQERES